MTTFYIEEGVSS